MTRKFLFCFPLRLGNVLFGYLLIAISIAVIAYNMYKLGFGLISDKSEFEDKFGDFENLENIFGDKKGDLLMHVMTCYYASYIAIWAFMFVFSALFTCGAYNANQCLVTTFFIYCFAHLFLSIALVIWEALTRDWLMLFLVFLSDAALIVCMFSVKYLMEAIRSGHIYTRPGEVYYKY